MKKMKKLFSLSKDVAERIEQVSKEQNTTQSRIIETAFVLYFVNHYQKNENIIKNEKIPQNQINIFDDLSK